MIIYSEKGGMEEKIEVKYNKKALKELQQEMLLLCGRVTNKVEQRTDDWFYCDGHRYKLNSKGPAIEGRDHFYTGSTTYYEFDYDERLEPYLYKLITCLIKGDCKSRTKALRDILAPNPDEDIYLERTVSEVIEDEIKILEREIDELINNKDGSYVDRRMKLSELDSKHDKLLEELELNSDREPISEYYKKAQALIGVNVIDQMPMELLEKVKKFYKVKK